MKNTDLTTIGNIIISVALLATMAALLITHTIDFTVAGYFLALVAALNGFTGALLAPSPKQGEQVASALAAAAPQVPLVNIVHPATSAPETLVSSAAMPPVQQQGPRPIMLQPTVPQPMTSAAQQNLPPQPTPFPQPAMQGQDWRNWTAMTEVPPTQQQ